MWALIPKVEIVSVRKFVADLWQYRRQNHHSRPSVEQTRRVKHLYFCGRFWRSLSCLSRTAIRVQRSATIRTGHGGTLRLSTIIRAAAVTTIATTATASAGLVDMVVTISHHLEPEPARRRQEPRHIRCVSQEYRASPVRRRSHRRHQADLGTAAASVKVASAEVDSAALAAASATAKPPRQREAFGLWRTNSEPATRV